MLGILLHFPKILIMKDEKVLVDLIITLPFYNVPISLSYAFWKKHTLQTKCIVFISISQHNFKNKQPQTKKNKNYYLHCFRNTMSIISLTSMWLSLLEKNMAKKPGVFASMINGLQNNKNIWCKQNNSHSYFMLYTFTL